MPVLYLDMNVDKRPFDDQNQMRIRLETVATRMIFSWQGMLTVKVINPIDLLQEV